MRLAKPTCAALKQWPLKLRNRNKERPPLPQARLAPKVTLAVSSRPSNENQPANLEVGERFGRLNLFKVTRATWRLACCTLSVSRVRVRDDESANQQSIPAP